MSLHTLTLCVKRLMRRIDEEVADAAKSHAPTCFEGHTLNHPKDASSAPPVHTTLLGA